MATRNTATHGRSALNSQPLPKLSSQANGRAEREKEDRRSSLSDAAVIVAWLNGAKQAKTSASYERIRSIHQHLAGLRETRRELMEFGPDPEQWNAAVREHEEKKKLFKAGKISEVESRFPGNRIDDDELYRETRRKAADLVRFLNQLLHRYVFRPQVAYALLPGSISILQSVWTGGMVPTSRRGFETTINGWPVSEADAAVALVRLDLSGDLAKVGLCEECHERWRVASKRSYRFCSKECRERFYTKSPDYHERKARTQRDYRRNLKRALAAFDAERKQRS